MRICRDAFAYYYPQNHNSVTLIHRLALIK
jgi:hypothetical protein